MKELCFTLVFTLLVAVCHTEAAVLLTSESQLLEPGTYEVASNVKITQNLTLKDGTTLIFNGGKLVADKEVTITGKSTAIEAPDAVVFTSNIKADGMWRISYASPLWWETVRTEGIIDYGPGINKAAIMVSKGVVQLPRGQYYIGEPLFLPAGVTLRGASGNSSWNDKTEKGYGGTTQLIPIGGSDRWIKSESGSGSKFMIYANATEGGKEGGTIDRPYPQQWKVLENIVVINSNALKYLRCVFTAGSGSFDGVVFRQFGQAIYFSGDYGDNKAIVNCSFFSRDENLHNVAGGYKREDYMVDMGFLGDALMINHCHFAGPGQPMIRISNCGGGVISDNIINGDVYVKGCKSVALLSNHMESGAQVKVESSVAEISNNLIEKRTRPSVDISGGSDDCSVVTLRNNQYLVYQQNRGSAEADKDKKAERFKNMSEIDIKIDNKSFLNIENEYRYEIVAGFNVVRPVGITVGTDNGDFTEFNQKSYAYSSNSYISSNYALNGSATFNDLNKMYIDNVQRVSNTDWFGESGDYLYSYQLVPDAERGIYECYNGRFTNAITAYYDNKTKPTLKLEKHGNGVLLGFTNQSNVRGVMLRLFRTRVKSESDHTPLNVETVDVPFVGGKALYDNGISICGYKWREIDSVPEPTSKVVYRALHIDGTNVSAWSESLPDTSKGWRMGDIIYNVGNFTDWQIKIVK